MAIVTEQEDGLTGQAGRLAAPTLAGADFSAVASEGAGSTYPVAMTASFKGRMAGPADEDFVSFETTAPTSFVFDIDGTAPGLDLFLVILDDGGNGYATIAGAAALDPGSTTTADPWFAVTLPWGGLWTLRVTVDPISPVTTGNYTLHVSNLDQALDYLGNGTAESIAGAPGLKDDTLRGQGGADSLVGGDGRDLLEGGDGNDLLIGDGEETLAGQGADTLRGGAGHDVLRGDRGSDRLEGGSGDDTLTGDTLDSDFSGLERDTLLGGLGNDLLLGGAGEDRLSGGPGNDTLIGGGEADRVLGGDGDDSLTGQLAFDLADTAMDVLEGGAGNDTLVGDWADRMLGGEGDDVVELRLKEASSFGPPVADGGSGTDLLRLLTLDASVLSYRLRIAADGALLGSALLSPGSVLSDTRPLELFGFERFLIQGGQADDRLTGGAGAETFLGQGGSGDVLLGNAGDDLLATIGDPAAEWSGSGLLVFDALLSGGDGADTLAFQGLGATGLAEGGAGADSLVAEGGVGAVELSGGSGNDGFLVAGGNLFVDGGEGSDLLTVLVPGAAGVAVIAASYGGGEGSVTWAGHVVDYTGIERLRLVGAGLADSLQGGGGADTLEGGAGADTLNGGAGADLLVGGAGNDHYFVDQAGDVLAADPSGLDRVRTGLSYVLPNGIEELQLTGTLGRSGTGNGLANLLLGNAGANSLAGLGGADTLDGKAGADTLSGGGGNDVFILRLGEAAGDRIQDFAGNGAGAGDVIRFVGYGAGAAVTLVSGNSWKVQGANGADSFTLIGSFSPAHDVIFA